MNSILWIRQASTNLNIHSIIMNIPLALDYKRSIQFVSYKKLVKTLMGKPHFDSLKLRFQRFSKVLELMD